MRLPTATIDLVLGFISGGSLLVASAVSFYLAYRTDITTLRVLSLLLGIFALAHGSYHLLFTFIIGYPARAFLDSTSVTVLIIFAVYYSKRGGLT